MLKCLSDRKLEYLACTVCRRWASKSFRKTVNLPNTTFPLSMKGNVVSTRERGIQKKCKFDDLYKWQESQTREKTYILHDGPPYANGKAHVGHAINKILKDVTNRYKLLQGYKVNYVPGWDCHGLPIEQKALAEMGGDHTKMQAQDIRRTARKFAEKTINIQKKAFKSWGIMADWNNCYFTFNKEFEAKQLEVFYQMYEKGLIYENYMPVFWSPSSRTALAEAELEYNEKHKSTAVYVKFPLINVSEFLNSQIGSNRCSVVIWTTTPWTLPANKAICYGNNIRYCLVKDEKTDELFIVNSVFINDFVQLIGKKLKQLCTFEGNVLEGCTYEHPLISGSQFPLLHANHVTDKGTGLVHTAPAHGHDDFHVAVRHNLPVECVVDQDGLYTKEAVCGLEGKSVLAEGNKIVMDLMRENILHTSEYEHSYPYDWRTKQPVILRASKQWFVNTSEIKDSALELLKDVSITPKSSVNAMTSQLENRTYWCVSRQRVWGVPIPVFYNTESGKPLITRASINHLKSFFLEHGSNCWWTHSTSDLLPPSICAEVDCEAGSVYRKGNDVLDIWFDSGSTWAAVLGDEKADLYLEGLDQFGGWFQSSLLTSVAVRNNTPYKSLLVHGFAVDEKGKKMSKSVGNVVDPGVVINGGKNKDKDPAYGVDVFRWWATQSHLDPLVHIGPSVLNKCHEQVFKIRKILRHLLGNLSNFESAHNMVEYTNLLPLDRYMLHLLYNFSEQVTSAYENYNYARVLVETEKFVNSQVSSFYFGVTKDRLYCDHAESEGRRSGQTVMYHILEIITKAVAPVLPHLAEEVYQYKPFNTDCDSIFKTTGTHAPVYWQDDYLAETFEHLSVIKKTFSKEIATENPVDFDAFLSAQPLLFQRLKMMQEELVSSSSSLCEALQTSQCSLLSRRPIIVPDDANVVDGTCSLSFPDGTNMDQKFLLLILPSERFMCGRCQRFTAEKSDELCQRCHNVLAEGWDL